MIRIGIALLIFFVVGALFIISNEELHLADGRERTVFFEAYRAWLTSVGGNVRQITGAVIAADWIPPPAR